MIGPMRKPDIQNLLQRPLQASREISNGVNHWSSNKSQTNFRPTKNPADRKRQRVNRRSTASGLAHSFFRSSYRVHR